MSVEHPYQHIPEATLDGLIRYRDHHIRTGGFLYAVLTNDLREAVARGDVYNLAVLSIIVQWCQSQLPLGSWGSERNVEDWIRQTARLLPRDDMGNA